MLKLRRFQNEDLQTVIEEFDGRALLAWSMGLGKTIMALKYAQLQITGPIVVVCPAVVKLNWVREAQKHFNRIAMPLYGRTPHLSKLPKRNALIVINYDILGLPDSHKPTWSRLLCELKPELVILDECHNVKEIQTQRSKAVRALCDDVPHVLGLSGTPIISKPIEIWNPLHIINPSVFPSRFAFGTRYCAAFQGPYGWDYSGASNLEELHQVLKEKVMVRRLKEDVLKDLPPRTRTVVPMDLAPADLKDYQHAVKEFIVWLAKRSRIKAARAMMAERVVRIGYLKRLAAEYKLKGAIEWIEEFLESSNEKLLVFGIHQKILRPILEKFRKTAVYIDGSIKAKDRQLAIDAFNRDKKRRLFIGNIIAGGVGWNCKSASNVAFVELDWVPGNHSQAIDRCSGIGRGTGNPLNIYFLVANDTLETELCEILQDKMQVIEMALDGKPVSSMPLWDELEAVLKRQNKTVIRKRKAKFKVH